MNKCGAPGCDFCDPEVKQLRTENAELREGLDGDVSALKECVASLRAKNAALRTENKVLRTDLDHTQKFMSKVYDELCKTRAKG